MPEENAESFLGNNPDPPRQTTAVGQNRAAPPPLPSDSTGQMEPLASASPPIAPPALPESSGYGWAPTPGLQRWAMISDDTPFREKAGGQGPILGYLPAEEEVDFMNLGNADGAKWCKVKLQDGQAGYIPGDTKIRQLLYVQLEQARGDLRGSPSVNSSVIEPLKRGARFLLVKTIKTDAESWVKIRRPNGQEGFVDGKAKIKSIGAKTRKSASHDMIVGGLFFFGGILITAITYSAASEGGGTYVVAWGAILFGGIQFFRGVFRAMSD